MENKVQEYKLYLSNLDNNILLGELETTIIQKANSDLFSDTYKTSSEMVKLIKEELQLRLGK
jgi:hypothetical protein